MILSVCNWCGGVLRGGTRELMNSVARRLCEGGTVSSRRESCSRGPQGCRRTPQKVSLLDPLILVDPQANILITSDTPVRACLADFGFMAIAYDGAGGPEDTSTLGGGTTPFMAPELLSPSKFGRTKCQVSKVADVYAFGMVILQVRVYCPASDHALKGRDMRRC